MDNSIRDPSSGSISQNLSFNNQTTTDSKDQDKLAVLILSSSSIIHPKDELKFKANSSKDIESTVKAKILSCYQRSSDPKILQSLNNGGVTISKKRLEKLINKCSKKLAKVPIGTTVEVSINKFWKTRKTFDATLVEKNSQFSLKIQELNKGTVDQGTQGALIHSTAVHSGKTSLFKRSKLKSDALHKETITHRALYTKVGELLTQQYFKNLLRRISPDPTSKIHIPILKAPHVAKTDAKTGLETGIYLEKGSGDLFDALTTKGRLSFNDRIQIAKDLIVAVHLFEAAGFAHLDLKPENIVLFYKDGVLRAKVIDMGFAEKHFGSLADEISINKGSPGYLDYRGINDSVKANKAYLHFGSTDQVNNIMVRRDRVALSRILLHLLFQGKVNAHEYNNAYTEWNVKFKEEHKEIEKLYNALQADKFFDLTEAVSLIEKFEKDGKIS